MLAGSLVAAFFAFVVIVASACVFREAARRFAVGRGSNETAFSYHAAWLRAAILAGIIFACGAVFVAAAIAPYHQNLGWIVAYSFVLILAGGVGAAELISRYRDNPTRAVATFPGFFYVSLNALGGVAALYLIYVNRKALNFATGEAWKDDTITLVKAVLLAGFSSLLFFRTSLFKFRAGDTELAIGPAIVLDTLLGAADRAVDRVMAEPRATFIHNLLKGVAFDKAAVILPTHCLALMQNVSNEETQRIAGLVNKLRTDKETPNNLKVLSLGLALLSVVGENVLLTAVQALKRDLEDSTMKLIEDVATVMAAVQFESARQMLLDYCVALWPSELPAEALQKMRVELKTLSEFAEFPNTYKSLLLGVKLARLTDGVTLRKAVADLGPAIKPPGTSP